jgi:hypothetical protein
MCHTQVEIDLPTGMRILSHISGTNFNISDVSAEAGGGPLVVGYTRLRLTNYDSDQWAFSQWTLGKMKVWSRTECTE